MKRERALKVGYSKAISQIEVTIPQGMTRKQLAEIISERVLLDAIGRLPRGCEACLSGDSLIIREELEKVINVRLEQ